MDRRWCLWFSHPSTTHAKAQRWFSFLINHRPAQLCKTLQVLVAFQRWTWEPMSLSAEANINKMCGVLLSCPLPPRPFPVCMVHNREEAEHCTSVATLWKTVLEKGSGAMWMKSFNDKIETLIFKWAVAGRSNLVPSYIVPPFFSCLLKNRSLQHCSHLYLSFQCRGLQQAKLCCYLVCYC